MERKISMKNIYSTSNSVEADAVISKLTDEGIHADCRREDNLMQYQEKIILSLIYLLMTGKRTKAKKLIDGNDMNSQIHQQQAESV